MNSRGWQRRLTAGVCLVAVGLGAAALAGCGRDGSDGGAQSDAGPLAEFFGWGADWNDGGPDESDEDRKKQYRVEELVAACMADLGFEYVAVLRKEPPGRHNDAYALEPEEFAKQYGYGISTMWGPGIDEEPYEEPDDPNHLIREGLSAAAQEEYDKALWGDWSSHEWDESLEDDEPFRPDPPGCYTEAQEEVYGFDDSGRDFEEKMRQFESLHEDWSKLYERIERDPRLTEARAGWAECMADAGYPGLEKPEDAQESVSQRMAELYQWEHEDGGLGRGGGAEDTVPKGDEPLPVEPEVDPAAHQAIRDYELAIAPVDFACKRDHYDNTYRKVQFDLETAFIEEHLAELEAYRELTTTMNERDGG